LRRKLGQESSRPSIPNRLVQQGEEPPQIFLISCEHYVDVKRADRHAT